MIEIRLLEESWFDGLILRIDDNKEDLHTNIAIHKTDLDTDIISFLETIEYWIQKNMKELYLLKAGKESK